MFVYLLLDTFVPKYIFQPVLSVDNFNQKSFDTWSLKAYLVERQFLRSFTHMHMNDQSVFGGERKSFESWKCFQFVFATRSDQISHLNRGLHIRKDKQLVENNLLKVIKIN